MTLLGSGTLALAVAFTIAMLGWAKSTPRGMTSGRLCCLRLLVMVALASAVALATASPSLARRSHGTQTSAANATPANAGEAVCRSRARDYAYDKHADPGQERLFFDKCMGH
ncbi:hypothetical protein [Methylobacterium brachythecii]|uniref:Uncharacterized protein n=1 Tax=Methylobacterium brachythecii TaxID=1176177 RepID=A0A7W6AR28_9HYPH|nr:hypothetical protein [Methylobacterium brachythecii]MBB3904322.1 hypothetical protein [Methylobacterium brachythecii]GLS46774.1 hypothetical protein GCM10007884_47710 [Methylobacterium brachythecii]